MAMIRINMLAGGMLGYVVRRCTKGRECLYEDTPPCEGLNSKAPCYLKDFIGPDALKNAQAFVTKINPKGALAQKTAR